jgi:hypothetical protein
MKVLIIISVLLSALSLHAVSVDTINVKSKITDVTVFTEGAQVTRQASEKFIKGKHILIFEKLPQELVPQSIQVNNIDNCKILSVKHFLSNSSEKVNKAAEKVIQDKIDKQDFRIKEINAKLGVFAIEQKLLLDNSYLARKNEGSAISEIKEAADYYRLRLTEIKNEELLLSEEYDSIKKKMQELYIQMNELLVNKTTTYSKIYIAVECEKELPAEITFSYFVNSAGWESVYDFRVDDISKPLNIVYNANIYQSSGEDWNNVNVKLSTTNPTLTGEKPELNTWYVERRSVYESNQKESRQLKDGVSAIRGKVIDNDNGDPLPFVNVIIEKDGVQIGGSVTDLDGNFLIKPITPGTYNLNATFVGYNKANITGIPLRAGLMEFIDVKLQSNSNKLEAVTITKYNVPLIEKDRTFSGATVTSEEIMKMPNRNSTGISTSVGGVFSRDGEVGYLRGQRSDGNLTYMDGVRVRGSGNYNNYNYRSSGKTKVENDFQVKDIIANTLRTNITNLEYTIEIPYSIPSDGADYSIKIKEVKTPVQYIYYAVPKLDNEVFLTAEVLDWNQLNLLSGKSSIYFQGTYTGESYIDASQTNDTLHISLGRDNNILVLRESNKTKEKRLIGNSIKETVGWDYTIKNNRNVPVKVVVEDQYPITERKSIEIELTESANAKVDPKTGKLVWEIELNPGEKKTFTCIYTVKYPRYEGVSTN